MYIFILACFIDMSNSKSGTYDSLAPSLSRLGDPDWDRFMAAGNAHRSTDPNWHDPSSADLSQQDSYSNINDRAIARAPEEKLTGLGPMSKRWPLPSTPHRKSRYSET
jgi:hypothetical protein